VPHCHTSCQCDRFGHCRFFRFRRLPCCATDVFAHVQMSLPSYARLFLSGFGLDDLVHNNCAALGTVTEFFTSGQLVD